MGEAGGGEGMVGNKDLILTWLEIAFSLSPNRWNRANLPKSRWAPPSLDFQGVAAMFHATFGKSEPPNA
jgi:hypothetical protein